MTDADDLREALAEEHPDWHPEVQRLVRAHVLKLEDALQKIVAIRKSGMGSSSWATDFYEIARDALEAR